MKVLVAEDDRVTAAILTRTLQRWQLEVVEASDGVAAWELLQTGCQPSIAIVDWMMPGLDGLELCRRIRHHEGLAGIHVILLTARDSHADVLAGLEAGADDYIVKPFDIEELQARVRVGIRVATLQDHLSLQVAELRTARDQLDRLASTDALTELSSRRRWFELATAEFDRYRRYRRPFGVLMADLDFFKRVNDTFGHSAGDEVLKQFAALLRAHCRSSDTVGRLGGEEFAVLLPETSAPVAADAARRIVESCRRLVVLLPEGEVRLTCSIGVAESVPSDEGLDVLIQRADAAMYVAKRAGRDRVHLAMAAPAAA